MYQLNERSPAVGMRINIDEREISEHEVSQPSKVMRCGRNKFGHKNENKKMFVYSPLL